MTVMPAERMLTRGIMNDFLKSLKSFKRNVTATADDLAKTLKKAATTGISTVDDVFSNIKINKTRVGLLTVADDVPIGKFERIIKAADLDALSKLGSTTTSVTSKEKAAFKTLIGDTAESQIHTLDELIESASKSSKFSDLNIKIITAETPPETISKIKKAEKGFLKLGKIGTPIALTIGVAYIVIDGLLKTTEARTGCFMVTTINNKAESCKISSFTCGSNSDDVSNLCATEEIKKIKLNPVLCLLSFEKTNAITESYKNNVCELSGISTADYMVKFNEILNSPKISEIFSYILTIESDISNNNQIPICEMSTITDVNKKLPQCRMCDPSASPLSTTYINNDSFGDNITFECRNPTILDTIIDITKSTGKNLLGAVESNIWGFIKPFAIALGVFAVVAFVIFLIIKLIGQAKKTNASIRDYNTARQYSRFA